jgi:hypothetical protein
MRPATAVLIMLSFLVAVSLPIGVLVAIRDTADAATGLAVTAAIVFGVVWLLLKAVKRVARPIQHRSGIVLPALVAAALITGAYAAIVYVWDQSIGPEKDFVGADILVPLGGAAAATFVVLYTTLSMARR